MDRRKQSETGRAFIALSFSVFFFSLSLLFNSGINRYLLGFSRASLVRKDYKSKCNMKSEISNSVHLYFTAKRSINIPFGLLIPAKSFKWFNWYYLKISVISIDRYRISILWQHLLFSIILRCIYVYGILTCNIDYYLCNNFLI